MKPSSLSTSAIPTFNLEAGIKTMDNHNVNKSMKGMSEKEFKEEWQKMYED